MSAEKSQHGWQRFIKLCRDCQTDEALDQLLDVFLTLEERAAINGRICIVYELLKGQLTQREIAQTHQVSIAKITRGSNSLKTIDVKLRQFLKQRLLS